MLIVYSLKYILEDILTYKPLMIFIIVNKYKMVKDNIPSPPRAEEQEVPEIPKMPELAPIDREKVPFTLYLSKKNVVGIKKILDKTGQSISRVIDNWIHIFIKQKNQEENEDV